MNRIQLGRQKNGKDTVDFMLLLLNTLERKKLIQGSVTSILRDFTV